jgi:ABC-type Fe3+/spermidine/putrescine transport system ATPase subunit
MQVEIKRIQRVLGITTIIVTHDQEEAISLADRVVVMDKGRIVQVGKPEDVFENPASPFIADFMGFVNFFSGTVESVTEETTRIRCGEYLIEQSSALCAADLAAGDSVKLAIRPEKILVSDCGGSSSQLLGRVESTTYKGNITRVEISGVFPVPLFVHSSDFHGSPGDSIGVCLPPEKIRVFKTK